MLDVRKTNHRHTPSIHTEARVMARSKVSFTSNLSLHTSHMVGLSGVEPLTSRLSGVRSNQLSYRPLIQDARTKRIEARKPFAFNHISSRLSDCSFRLLASCLLLLALSKLDRVVSYFFILPRKEVIQPHLPIRLPCYDFTPITDPTFDGCLRLRCEKWDVGSEIFSRQISF